MSSFHTFTNFFDVLHISYLSLKKNDKIMNHKRLSMDFHEI